MTAPEPNPADKVYGLGNDSTLNRMRYLAGVADALGSVRVSASLFRSMLDAMQHLDHRHDRMVHEVARLEAKVKKLRGEGKP